MEQNLQLLVVVYLQLLLASSRRICDVELQSSNKIQKKHKSSSQKPSIKSTSQIMRH